MTLKNVSRAFVALAVAALIFANPHAAAQTADYPSRPVKMVVPFPPGGSTDIMARTVAQSLSEMWKQPVIVENRPGAGGMIGADAVAKSNPDGYTLLVATIAHAVNVSLYPKAPYRFERDLQPVSLLGLLPLVAVVPAASPIRSLRDLVEASKRAPLNAGSSGNGSSTQLTLELFKGLTGANIQHVPYKGGAQAMTDLLGGRLDVIFALLPECAPHVKSGALRALAVTTENRQPLLPDIPTTTEVGLPQLQMSSWNGLMAPAATPKDIVARINADLKRVLQDAGVRRRIEQAGFEPDWTPVAQTEAFMKSEVERWAQVVREHDIKAE